MIFIFPLLTINEAYADEKPLRYQVRDAIEIGNCEKAAELSEVWELEGTSSKKYWKLRYRALECLVDGGQIQYEDRLFYAYKNYTKYGGDKEEIQAQVDRITPKLFDLRVEVEVPKDYDANVKLTILEKPWAKFNSEYGALYIRNITPGNLNLMVESDNPDLPNHIVSFEAFANEELEVKVNWPLASLYVPTISDGVSLKIKLPTDLDPTSTGIPYQGGEMVQTLAGKALVDAQFEGFPGNKPYEYEIKKGQNALILPWGYELTLDGQVLEKEIFAPWQPTVFRDEIPIPLIVNGQKVELSGSITIEPQQGKIQKFEITSSMLPLGQAQLDVKESKKELKRLLRPAAVFGGAALASFIFAISMEDEAQEQAAIARGVSVKAAEEDYLQAFEDYESAKTKAIAFRQTARVGVLGGLGLIASGIVFTAKPASQALQKYNRAQAKLARFQRRTIDLNILIDEYESDQLEAPNRKRRR